MGWHGMAWGKSMYDTYIMNLKCHASRSMSDLNMDFGQLFSWRTRF